MSDYQPGLGGGTPGGVDLSPLAALRATVMEEVSKVIVGQAAILDHMLVAMIAGGHILLEGVPGVAKTLMVKTLAHVVQADFKRIQFTPDLMPSDIVGTNVFDLQRQVFHFTKGPLFTDFCLADEINRAPAKTQSALLEAMEERSISVDGKRHDLGALFMVCATQNPVESEGTYPLPEAQLDRFMVKVKVPYPTPEEEDRLLAKFAGGFSPHSRSAAGVERVLTPEALMAARETIQSIRIEPEVIQYIRRVVHATRQSQDLMLGGGPRASITLLTCARVVAGLRNRDFVTPDDVKFMAIPVLRHRVILQPEVELDGISAEEVITNLLSQIEVPR